MRVRNYSGLNLIHYKTNDKGYLKMGKTIFR